MWLTTCVSSAVLDNRHLHYVFRPQVSGNLYGVQATDMIAEYAKSKFGKDPKDLRVAIVHEDGAAGMAIEAVVPSDDEWKETFAGAFDVECEALGEAETLVVGRRRDD